MSLDELLIDAGAELDRLSAAHGDADGWPTAEHRRRPWLAAVAAVALVGTAAGTYAITRATSPDPVSLTTAPPSTPTPATEVVDTAAQRALLQAQIAELQRSIDDLTTQIEAVLAQGDSASPTALQVLQQRQSLAIRDLAAARDQLANLDLDHEDPTTKRQLLQAHMDDQQRTIDDLTTQIETLLVQDDGSPTQLQVLQQQQSLVIRDLAAVGEQLADLDIEADPLARRQSIQARIDELQTTIDNLTTQIETLLALGDQASQTQLNVLQQEQSLAIRDLSNRRDQLAEIDIDVAPPTEKQSLLQARIDDLQNTVDDLTVQIDALLAQGDQASQTQVQVLQQQQSLAIRDLAEAHEQLAELGIAAG